MAVRRTVALLGILFLSFLSIVYMKSSYKAFRGVLLLVGRAFFLVLLSSWLVSVLYPRLRSFSPSAPPPPPRRSRTEDEDMKQRQEQARKEQQETLRNKAAAYHESVLMPRQESKLRKKEERFYRMTGEAWKLSPGQPLGEGESVKEHLEDEDLDDTPNVRAIQRRKIPECTTRILVQTQPPQEKKVIILPDEPSENDEGVVRVVLRCPSGRTIQRKFLKSHHSLVLLEWMQKIGYPPALYTVCTSYPRTALDTAQDLSLEDAGIDTDTVLHIEEKDPCTA